MNYLLLVQVFVRTSRGLVSHVARQVQQFAKQYSDDVEGLVLVESVHAAQFERLGPLFPLPHLSEDARLADMQHFWTEGWKSPTSTREKIDFRLSLGSPLGAGALGDIPLRILTTGSFLRIPFLPPSVRANLQVAWIDLQKDFLELSSDSVSTHWSSSSHFLQRDNPHAITAVVCDLISGKRMRK
ncbi:hypothetical protein [Rhizobium sp. NFR07]|uniref:hypothetical protein n=1 Tax=Rhizobium sp. NFR07 TaxID=1566262 RepID=UPI000B836DF4|nr:hypothetical protein [Rhizobium sp. NFR07]